MVFAIISLVVTGALIVADQLIKLLVTTQLQPIGNVTLIPGLLDFIPKTTAQHLVCCLEKQSFSSLPRQWYRQR